MKTLRLALIVSTLALTGCSVFSSGKSCCKKNEAHKSCKEGKCKKDKSCCKNSCKKCEGDKSCKKHKH